MEKTPIGLGRLYWRIFWFGFIQFVFIYVTIIFIFLSTSEFWRGGPFANIAKIIAVNFSPVPSDSAVVRERLENINRILGIDMAVYTPDGTIIASAGLPPAWEPDEAISKGESFTFFRGLTVFLASPLKPGKPESAYLVIMDPLSRGIGLLRFPLILLAVFFIIVAISYLLAYRIAHPIERIYNTVLKLKSGDLHVRTGIKGSTDTAVIALAIDEMAARLQQKLDGEKELMANISHEIRTPLARLRVAIALCEEEDFSVKEFKDRLKGMEQDLAELERLVNDVLEVSRLDLGEGKGMILHRDIVNITTIVKESKRRFVSLHPDCSLIEEIHHDLPEVKADEGLLRRVMDNILDNAAKYSAPSDPITIAVRGEASNLIVEICDRGIGVAPEELERLFDPFFRTTEGRGSKKSGMGLGLTLCRRIVEAHGGRISALPNDEHGLIVRFSLPANQG